MRFIKNANIKKKLLSGFLMVAIISLIVGCVGTVGLLTLNGNEDTLYKEGVESLTGVTGMYAVIVEQRLELRGMIINIDEPEAVKVSIDNLRTREKEFDELYSLYLAATSGTDEKENEIMQKTMDIYNGQLKVLKEQMVTALQSGDKATARRVFEQTAEVAEVATEGLNEMVWYGNNRAADINEQDSRTAFMLIVITAVLTVVSVILAVALGLYNAKIIANPISNMANVAHELSIGNVEVNISVKSSDEIGELAKSFEKMIEGIREQAVLLGAIAEGDYTVSVPIRSDKDVINRAIQELVRKSGDMMMEIQKASVQVSAGAGQVSQAAQGLASGSSEQAASIEEFTASLAELQEKTNHNAENSAKALEANIMAGEKLKDSINSMNELLEAMKAIDESSGSITKVIKVIDDIAFQTNILALNAAVEAARAGQHGKGFAVVADEVRNLASKSAAAAKETATLIEGSSERVNEGNQIVAKTNAGLEIVNECARELARVVNKVAADSAEQARTIGEINQGIEQISIVVQANSATAEESAAAAQEMSAQAVVMNEIVAQFKLGQSDPEKINFSGSVETADLFVYKPGEQTNTSGFTLFRGKKHNNKTK